MGDLARRPSDLERDRRLSCTLASSRPLIVGRPPRSREEKVVETDGLLLFDTSLSRVLFADRE